MEHLRRVTTARARKRADFHESLRRLRLWPRLARLAHVGKC